MSGLRITFLGDVEEIVAPEVSPRTTEARPVEIRPIAATDAERSVGARRLEVTVDGWVLHFRVEDEARAALAERARRGRTDVVAHAREVVRARIPGRITRIWVAPGQSVAAGERLLAVEAMKMENEVRAPRAGVIGAIAVEPGQPVELNAELLTID